MMIHVAAGIVLRDGKVFLAKREKHQDQGDVWEFPGGKCESGESPEQALVRELQEEIAITPKSVVLFDTVTHDYGKKKVCLYFYLVESFDGEAVGHEGQKVAWVDLAQLADLEFPAANKVIVEKLLS